MQKRLFGTFIFLRLFAFAQYSAALEEDGKATSTRLHLIWQDGNNLLSSGQDSVGREVVKRFQTIGVDVEWVNEANPGPESGAVRIRVFLFGDPVYWRQSRNTMGITFGGNGPQSSIYIFFHSIARTLGWSPDAVAGRMLDPKKRMALTRSLGRVIAHEVFHAVAPSLPHGPKGLTQAKLDRDFLLSSGMDIHPHSASVFRFELTKLSGGDFGKEVAALPHEDVASEAWKQ